MRAVLLAFAAALSAGACADNLINIPIGRKVPQGVLRFESRFDQNDFNPVELSFGVQYHDRALGFVGLLFPFSEQFRFLAEDDGRRISTGFEWRQNDSLSLRWLFEDSRPKLSLRWQMHL